MIISKSKMVPINLEIDDKSIFIFGTHLYNSDNNKNSIIFCDYKKIYEYEIDDIRLTRFFKENTVFINININDCKELIYADSNESMTIDEYLVYLDGTTTDCYKNNQEYHDYDKIIILYQNDKICNPIKTIGYKKQNNLILFYDNNIFYIDLKYTYVINGIYILWDTSKLLKSKTQINEFFTELIKIIF